MAEARGFRVRGSLALRILLLNVVPLVLLGGAVFYLDAFRERLIDERRLQQETLARTLAAALGNVPRDRWQATLKSLGSVTPAMVRVYERDGQVSAFSRSGLSLVDPASEPWRKRAARSIDRGIDWVVGAPPIPAAEAPLAGREAWSEIEAVKRRAPVASRMRYAPDRTPIVSAAAPIASDGAILLAVENSRDVTRLVRAERLRLGQAIGLALMLSLALSLFLARTIADPLRRLARAAMRVKLGREREVVVPRLEGRQDEIGLLARALSDMTGELRDRIDAIEGFAADVSHELKNPLASLRSALDSFERVTDPHLRAQLLAILRDDVVRLDRLITDIAEMSRLDAQLTRTPFAPVDMGELIEALLAEREKRGLDGAVRIAYARPYRRLAMVAGDAERLRRAIGSLIDNAVSFSPVDGVVRVGATRVGEDVLVTVEDQGPGVPPPMRETIFQRFYSDRVSEGDRHSGLGLAIASTIIEGHRGSIEVTERDEGRGARFIIRLPLAGE